MRTTLLFLLTFLIAGSSFSLERRSANESIDAFLTPAEKGYLRIVIENKGREPIRLLDVREGAATCASIWTVEIKMQDGQELSPMMWYQPGDSPHIVTIQPGKSYERLIQPLAYVRAPESGSGRAKIVVHYEVKEPFKTWSGLEPENLRFSTRPLELDLSQL